MPYSDLDRLFEFCLPFAKGQLQKHQSFHPFAAMVKADSTLSPLGLYEGEEFPKAEQSFNRLVDLFKSLLETGDLVASAICYNGIVTVPGKADQSAIIVSMEREGGVAVTISVPYSKKFLRGYVYDHPFRMAAEPRIFSRPSTS